MSEQIDNSRRKFFGTGLAAAGFMAGSSAIARTLEAVCTVTPAQTEGPFYPLHDQPDEDNDLTNVRGSAAIAAGERVYIVGQVLDASCAPVANALVEIWQACASGKYNHPNDTNPAPLDPNFQYWGKAVTDSNGNYQFKTIVPGAYPADVGWIRPPHIHFKVHKLGFHELTTQMYFAGQKLNDEDKILLQLSPSQRQQVIVAVGAPQTGMDPAAKLCKFDLTLTRV